MWLVGVDCVLYGTGLIAVLSIRLVQSHPKLKLMPSMQTTDLQIYSPRTATVLFDLCRVVSLVTCVVRTAATVWPRLDWADNVHKGTAGN